MSSSKNLAIFCDGTWQQISQPTPTNVSRLARMVLPADERGCAQVVYYDSGVGVASGRDLVSDLTKDMGGAFGMGLLGKIINAYQFLCLNYTPGDKIYIFGFSRGAYTARSLAGLLNLTWILERKNGDHLIEVPEFYQDPRRVANDPGRPAYEAMLSNWSDQLCYPRSSAHINYLGVWDTVGELGIPTSLLGAGAVNAKYRFHDTTLSPITQAARHAVSIDEQRNTYSPTIWPNVAELNKAAENKPYKERSYQQCWFPGHHSGVGGGQNDQGLSNSALKWIAQGAQVAGLAFDHDQINAAVEKPEADFVIDATTVESVVADLVGGTASRLPGPAAIEEVSEAALTRWKLRKDYRNEPSLARVQEGMINATGEQ